MKNAPEEILAVCKKKDSKSWDEKNMKLYYIQGILGRLTTVLTLGKTAQFFIPDPPTGVELEQLTDSPPHISNRKIFNQAKIE